MSRLNLTPWQRRRLRRQLAQTRDARLYRKTLAVLEFDHGRSAADIARMLGVTRQTVYDWVEAYTQDHDPASLQDQPGRGRYLLLDEDQAHLLEALLASPPRITATRTRPGPCPCSKSRWRSPPTCESLRRPFAGSCTGWTTCGSGRATT